MENNHPLEKDMEKVQLNPENVGNGLVKLVLSLINTIRELMEKQALQKIETDQLSEEQIEKVGCTLLALEDKIKDLQKTFDLSDQDLEIDLRKYINVE